jgi:hypothetical protein
MLSMRDFLKSSGRRLRAGWFWPLLLLALPTCTNDYGAFTTFREAFDPGPEPRTSVIMCDIPKVPPDSANWPCAMPMEIASLLSMSQAAVLLATSQSSTLVLDFSSDAQLQCGQGVPRKIEFYGSFPDGLAVCLNCAQIPVPYADANAACRIKCKDLVQFDALFDGQPAPGGADAFCAANAHVSTNFDGNPCYPNACLGGTPLSPPDFVDPRRTAELVQWAVGPNDGTSASGNDLTRTAPTTGGTDQDFNAGSAAAQVIMNGDGWVEFEVGDSQDETQLSHVLGVSVCVSPCKDGDPQDNDPSLADIQFSISLNSNTNVYVIENPGLIVHGPYPPYMKTERFRVNFVDNHDGKATISFARSCTAGTICLPFFTSASTVEYPLRVDTSFREQNATLKNVTLVRIK